MVLFATFDTDACLQWFFLQLRIMTTVTSLTRMHVHAAHIIAFQLFVSVEHDVTNQMQHGGNKKRCFDQTNSGAQRMCVPFSAMCHGQNDQTICCALQHAISFSRMSGTHAKMGDVVEFKEHKDETFSVL